MDVELAKHFISNDQIKHVDSWFHYTEVIMTKIRLCTDVLMHFPANYENFQHF